MNSSVLLTPDYDWEYEPQGTEWVYLDEERVATAIALGDRVPQTSNAAIGCATDHTWQAYLHGLALQGFQQWLQERNPDLTTDLESATLLLPTPERSIGAICNLAVNQFRVCLILTESWTEDQIRFPQAVLESPDLQAQFYVAIAVYEEQAAVSIEGFFPAPDLQQALQAAPAPQAALVSVSRSHLNTEVDRLLLHLSCLDSSAIPRSSVVSQANSQLNPVSDSKTIAPFVTRSHLQELLVQPVINTAQWFQNQIASLQQEVEWLMAPPLVLSPSSLRNRTSDPQTILKRARSQELANLLTELARQGVQLPSDMCSRCQDLQVGDLALQLYVVAAIASSNAIQNTNEWSLLLILRHPVGEPLPEGLQFQVSDLQQTLVQQTIQPSQSSDYLYANLIANCDEQFVVTITLADQTALTLPPIAFMP
ncbi:MAG: DUF1822 family protein [Synechococcales bacterium]|nr:DUF1822 family protein [Synechococcales bacterium]